MRVDGVPIDLGHPRQRYVLAVLLIDANRPVPMDKLADRVWGDGSADRTRATLYSYLSRIRSVLASANDVALRRQSSGYVLEVDPAAVDLFRFERLIAEARAAADERAMVLYSRALGLWRGDALCGMDSPWLNAVRARVNRERLEAELDRNDVALRRGWHAGLLPGLYARAEAHPLDERLAGQLMVAMYRNGRAAEALDLFHTMRRRLVDDLGTEPGPALRRVQQRILMADPELTGDVSLDSAAPVPRQLPAPPRLFVGRARESAYLDLALGADGARGRAVPIVTLGGIGGIGKTCLALQWAHRNVAHFPDGQLYLNLRGFDPHGSPMLPEVALRTLLDALGVSPGEVPAGIDARAGLYRSLVAGRRMLLLLDNAQDSAQVTPLLPGDSSCAVLVTSRHRLDALATSHGALQLELDALSESEASELLTGHLGVDRVIAGAQTVRELLEHCSGLPLALSMVAARAAARPGLPLATLADELREVGTRLDILGSAELSANLRAVFACSLRDLDRETVSVFASLGLAPGTDVSLLAAACLTRQPVARARISLAGLEYAYLIQQHKPNRYRMHSLVRLYAAELAKADYDDATRSRAATRLIDYYLHTACAGERLLRPHNEPIELDPPAEGCLIPTLADPAAALAWFEDEHAGMVAAFRMAVARECSAVVWKLAWALDTFFARRGYRQENAANWEAALAAVQRLDDPAALMLTHRRLGRAYSTIGRHEDARDHLYKALSLASQRNDLLNRAHTQIALARAWELSGSDDRARVHGLGALHLFQTLGNTIGEATALNAVGWYTARRGHYASARTYAVRALALYRHNGNKPGEAAALDSLGYIAHCTGEYTLAIAHYGDALALYREIGDHYTEADTLVRLSDARAAAGKGPAARRDLQEALVLYRAQHRTSDIGRIEQQLACAA